MLWQQKIWGEMLVKSSQAEKIFDIQVADKDLVVRVEKRKVSLGEYGLFVIGLEQASVTKDLENQLIDLCKKQKALFVQVETLSYSGDFSGFRHFYKLKIGFYKKFITPYTALIDLTKSEDDILKLMKPKGRYNIKVARKKDIQIKFVEKTDENIKIFFELMKETTSRDGFSGNSFEYYKTFLEMLDFSRLIFAYKDEIVISAGIFVFDKQVSIYYYGASSSNPKYRNMMAPYLLQWEAIKYAKDFGSKIYDFLGVATPGDPRSSLLGVTGFKMKLSQDLKWVSESYIFVNKKIKYFLISTLRKIKS